MKREKYNCPVCGCQMKYVGGLLDWECPSCGSEGNLEYDKINKQFYVSVDQPMDYTEIYKDPISNKPKCCEICGGPYPKCMTSCKLFD